MLVDTDYILNGVGHGEVAGLLSEVRDPGFLRPYIDERGRRCVTINTGKMVKDKEGNIKPERKSFTINELHARGMGDMVSNASPTSLRKLEWEMIDRVVLRAARSRLRAWADLAGANTFGGFNGMAKMLLEHETMSDPGTAQVDFDGMTEGRTDAPRFQLEGLPLPITHSDFWFSSRVLAISRNTGTPLDSTMGEAAGRRVAEMIEKTLIGTVTGPTYGGGSNSPAYGRTSSVYGYTNFSSRLTKTDSYRPTGNGRSTTGWVPADTLKDVLAMIDVLTAQNFFGPFMLYHSNDWDQYLDNDYILSGGNVATQTLRNRLRSIEVIQDVRRLDFLTSSTNPFTMLLVQMTPEVARAVNGMDITVVQWPTMGGLRLNFKVMAIQVPQLRADYYGNCGVLHSTCSH